MRVSRMAREEELNQKTQLNAVEQCLAYLFPALDRLDHILDCAISSAQEFYGASPAGDRYRGLYISQDDAKQLLNRAPGEPLFKVERDQTNPPSSQHYHSRLGWLQRAYGLSVFELDVLLIAIAPEIDLRYGRLYAYLQDDVSRKHPSVDLALNLLCTSIEEKLIGRAYFAPDAPLIRHQLLHLFTESVSTDASSLAQAFRLDEQIVRFVLGETCIDPRLTRFCQFVDPAFSLAVPTLSTERVAALNNLLEQAIDTNEPLQLYFNGPKGAGKRATAEAIAAELDMSLLVVDLAQALTKSADFDQTLTLLFREVWFVDAILYLEGVEALQAAEYKTVYQHLLRTLSKDDGISILAGDFPWIADERYPLEMIVVPFAPLNFDQRRDCWKNHIATQDIHLSHADLDTLAGRFQLNPGQIANAVTMARGHARWRTAAQLSTTRLSEDETTAFNVELILTDLLAAARLQTGQNLATLAQKIDSPYRWSDLVVPDDTLAQLKEMCHRVLHRHRVLSEWGFHQKLALGKGINALFAGSSGTGKTMASGIIANELGLDLYKIDLSGVVSKYIGETEKNLDRIFAAAEHANAILLFDEADALFGKRSEVRDSHDRYANLEISYLLQKMEEYDGIAILATNLRQNLDEAFIRRLAFSIHFPFPEEADRQRIWESIWPDATPLAEDIHLDRLAQRFKLSGGSIKNIALSAAFLAAKQDEPCVSMVHLLQATRREYQKLGKFLSDAELYDVHHP